MSVTRTKPQPAPAVTAEASAPTGVRAWLRDLGMGMRFAAGGGREGWVRTILTAVGVGLGVALLLGAASVPYLTEHRSDRSSAREAADRMTLAGKIRRSDTTVLMRDTFTTFRDRSLEGRFVRAEGGRPSCRPASASCPATTRWWSRPRCAISSTTPARGSSRSASATTASPERSPTPAWSPRGSSSTTRDPTPSRPATAATGRRGSAPTRRSR